jgi:hypothetical protein
MTTLLPAIISSVKGLVRQRIQAIGAEYSDWIVNMTDNGIHVSCTVHEEIVRSNNPYEKPEYVQYWIDFSIPRHEPVLMQDAIDEIDEEIKYKRSEYV